MNVSLVLGGTVVETWRGENDRVTDQHRGSALGQPGHHQCQILPVVSECYLQGMIPSVSIQILTVIHDLGSSNPYRLAQLFASLHENDITWKNVLT